MKSSPNSAEVLVLLFLGLEPTVADLGASIDELESDLFEGGSVDLGDNRFPQETDSLLGANAAASDHDEVILDDTIMREATERGDVLFSQVGEGGGIVLDAGSSSLAHPVDLLVEFGSVMETMVTSPRDSPPYSGWVP